MRLPVLTLGQPIPAHLFPRAAVAIELRSNVGLAPIHIDGLEQINTNGLHHFLHEALAMKVPETQVHSSAAELSH